MSQILHQGMNVGCFEQFINGVRMCFEITAVNSRIRIQSSCLS